MGTEKPIYHRQGMTRREALKRISIGVGGAALTVGMPFPLLARPATARAKSVIQIWMWGGPSHIDTFDPKPDAGYDYTGPLKEAIDTNVDGIRIGKSFPLLAAMADRYSIVRSMTHGFNGHETASYMVQTGRKPGGRIVYPCAGAVVSLKKGYAAGYQGLLPPYIVMTRPQGRFSEAGFLGYRYKPFATGGNPAAERFTVEGIISEKISEERQINRRALLSRLDTFGKWMQGNAEFARWDSHQQRAYDMILGSTGKVFDLSQEPETLRRQYGLNTFGQSCLVARRLVEQGVPYITINYQGWDTHKQHFEIMRRKLPELDKGLSTLLADLSRKGLLESTIVWWGGEFGRTPRVQWEAPWNGGRGHYGKAFSVVVAGGGFKGGTVVGATDDRGEEVRERPVYPSDLIGSIYELLGIDPDSAIRHPSGAMVPLTSATDKSVPTSGRLREIM